MSSSISIDALLSAQASADHNPTQIQCCCRDSSCAFLVKGRTAFQSLHTDIRNAASVGQVSHVRSSSPRPSMSSRPSTVYSFEAPMQPTGARIARQASVGPHESLTWSLQALLVRHESYVSNAEQDKGRLRDQLAILEAQNKQLETDNARTLSENRQLLDQLDSLNVSLEESDARIKSLTATLQSTQHEYHRLKLLAARTEVLEEQLFRLEQDQERLRCTLTTTAEEERAARQGWRESQRTVVELQRQVEQVEDEARQDKQRHAELLERNQRRTDIKSAMNSSRARSEQQPQQADQNGEVVSAFVREILEDNTKLQLNMAELRDMLLESQDETELLRNRLTEADFDESPHVLKEPDQKAPSLGTELGEHDSRLAQQLHVHHHYHGARPAQSRARPAQPRMKRKRPALLAGLTPSIPEAQAQHFSSHGRQDSTASSVFSDDSASRTRLWSHQHALSRTSIAASSGPSSPRSSAYCPSTIFEQGSDGNDTSITRPSSPGDGSEAPWSPTLKPGHARMASECANLQPLVSSTAPAEDASSGPICPLSDSLRPEISVDAALMGEESKSHSPRRALKKSPSSSSLISVSGMDIHSTFPSSSLLGAPTALRSRHSNADISSRGAVVSITNASASIAEQAGRPDVGSTLRQSLARAADAHPTSVPKDSFSSWLVSRWKGRQEPQTDHNGKDSQDKSRPSESINTKSATAQFRPRAAGVNQLGALPIEEYMRRHARPVVTTSVDPEALKECLEEDVDAAAIDRPFADVH